MSQVANPKLAGDLLDIAIKYSQGSGGSQEEAQQETNRILVVIVAVTLVGAVSSGLRSWLFQSAAEHVMYKLRTRVFSAILAQEMGFFDRVGRSGLACGLGEAPAPVMRRMGWLL